jgi:RsiW-degrading membrane proteinase PrsW (M82 family)
MVGGAALTASVTSGCTLPLSGTNDGALYYSVETGAPNPPDLDARELAARVKARLASGNVAADVTASDERTVRVDVDLGAARTVDALVSWPGGLGAYPVDPTFAFAPGDGTGLVVRTRPLPDGRTERFWEGSRDAVERAAAGADVGTEHLVFAERITGDRFRTRVVRAPSAIDAATGPGAVDAVGDAAHGRALSVWLGPGARAALAADARIDPILTDAVAVAFGPALFASVSRAQAIAAPLVLSVGDDLAAFSRADEARRLLASPSLPRLRHVATERVPVRWGVATACALLPLVVSIAWLLFVRRFDRARPEPWWLVLATFALGGVAVLPALAVELLCAAASPWLDPSLVTLGGRLWSLPVALPVYALVVGLTEETSKFGATWVLARRRPEFDEPIDGIVYACAAALGFAAVENVKYFALGRMGGAMVAVRSLVTVPAHMFFGAIWGYALGRTLVSRRTRVGSFVAAAALAHGTFDALLSIQATQIAATLMILPLGVAFFAALRLALRHGAVRRVRHAWAPMTERLPASALERSFFPVGSPVAFVACATAMIAVACALMQLGTGYEAMHERIGLPFVAAAAFALLVFGLAGYAAAATMPLDVAVDAHGVTFAGATQPWGSIFGANVAGRGARTYVELRTARGALRLGPTGPRTARALERAVRDALALSDRERA